MLSPLPPPGCESGSFGEGCNQQCDCEDGVPCDPITGHCLCPPGLMGATCDLGESGIPLGGGHGRGSLSVLLTVLKEPHLCHVWPGYRAQPLPLQGPQHGAPARVVKASPSLWSPPESPVSLSLGRGPS